MEALSLSDGSSAAAAAVGCFLFFAIAAVLEVSLDCEKMIDERMIGARFGAIFSTNSLFTLEIVKIFPIDCQAIGSRSKYTIRIDNQQLLYLVTM